MRASQFISENIDSDAVNELDTYIMNNEDLYRRRFMPIISNIKRKLAKNVYDHEKAQTLMDVPSGRRRERNTLRNSVQHRMTSRTCFQKRPDSRLHK